MDRTRDLVDILDSETVIQIALAEAAVNQDFRKFLRFWSAAQARVMLRTMDANPMEWDDVGRKGGPMSLVRALGRIEDADPRAHAHYKPDDDWTQPA